MSVDKSRHTLREIRAACETAVLRKFSIYTHIGADTASAC